MKQYAIVTGASSGIGAESCAGVACVGVHARVVCVGVPVRVWRAQVCLRGWGMHRCACVGVACVGVHAWVWHVCLQA